jgi:hypothetical protein
MGRKEGPAPQIDPGISYTSAIYKKAARTARPAAANTVLAPILTLDAAPRKDSAPLLLAGGGGEGGRAPVGTTVGVEFDAGGAGGAGGGVASVGGFT